jgi:NADPH:quinone reductase-like Zn-dependent oxidoreductase
MATLEDVRQSLAMLQASMIKAVITASLKFSEAARAHAMIEARAVEGRVVLQGW